MAVRSRPPTWISPARSAIFIALSAHSGLARAISSARVTIVSSMALWRAIMVRTSASRSCWEGAGLAKCCAARALAPQRRMGASAGPTVLGRAVQRAGAVVPGTVGTDCPPVPGTGALPVMEVAPVPVPGTLPVLSERLLLRSPPETSPPGGTARSGWLVLPLFSGEEAASWARTGPAAKLASVARARTVLRIVDDPLRRPFTVTSRGSRKGGRRFNGRRRRLVPEKIGIEASKHLEASRIYL